MDESKHLIKKRFSKAVTTYHDNAIIQRLIASTLFSCYNRFNDETEKNVLEIGCGSGFLTKEILDGCNLSKITINDIVDYSERIGLLINSFQNIDYKFMQGDAENLIYNESYDLIFSSSVFQWFSNLRFFLQKASMILNKDGIIAFSTFLPGNLYEIKELTGISLNYHTEDYLKSIISENFEILSFEDREYSLRFKDPIEVLRHIQKTGVNSVSDFRWTKSTLDNFRKEYIIKFQKEGEVTLTYHPVYIIAKKNERNILYHGDRHKRWKEHSNWYSGFPFIKKWNQCDHTKNDSDRK